jgi:VanZ family protein
MKSQIKYRLKIIIVISYAVFIWFFSEYKFPDPSGGTSGSSFSIFPFLHMGEFGLLIMLLMFAFYKKINTIILLSISVLYGFIDEIHQYFIPYRWFDANDILCDTIGSFLGLIGFFILLLIYNYFLNRKSD